VEPEDLAAPRIRPELGPERGDRAAARRVPQRASGRCLDEHDDRRHPAVRELLAEALVATARLVARGQVAGADVPRTQARDGCDEHEQHGRRDGECPPRPAHHHPRPRRPEVTAARAAGTADRIAPRPAERRPEPREQRRQQRERGDHRGRDDAHAPERDRVQERGTHGEERQEPDRDRRSREEDRVSRRPRRDRGGFARREPAPRLLAEAAHDEQRVVHTHAEADHRHDVLGEHRDRGPEMEQVEPREPDRHRDDRQHDRQECRERRPEDDEQDHEREREPDPLRRDQVRGRRDVHRVDRGGRPGDLDGHVARQPRRGDRSAECGEESLGFEVRVDARRHDEQGGVSVAPDQLRTRGVPWRLDRAHDRQCRDGIGEAPRGGGEPRVPGAPLATAHDEQVLVERALPERAHELALDALGGAARDRVRAAPEHAGQARRGGAGERGDDDPEDDRSERPPDSRLVRTAAHRSPSRGHGGSSGVSLGPVARARNPQWRRARRGAQRVDDVARTAPPPYAPQRWFVVIPGLRACGPALPWVTAQILAPKLAPTFAPMFAPTFAPKLANGACDVRSPRWSCCPRSRPPDAPRSRA
jgi:hypothetical protein